MPLVLDFVFVLWLDVLGQTAQEPHVQAFSFSLMSSLKIKWLDDFSHDVCGVAVFARWFLVSQSSVARFPPLLLKTELSLAFTREILVFFRLFHS